MSVAPLRPKGQDRRDWWIGLGIVAVVVAVTLTLLDGSAETLWRQTTVLAGLLTSASFVAILVVSCVAVLIVLYLLYEASVAAINTEIEHGRRSGKSSGPIDVRKPLQPRLSHPRRATPLRRGRSGTARVA